LEDLTSIVVVWTLTLLCVLHLLKQNGECEINSNDTLTSLLSKPEMGNLKDKSCIRSVFVNKVLWEYIPSHQCAVYGCFRAWLAKLSRCKRDTTGSTKMKLFTIWSSREMFADPHKWPLPLVIACDLCAHAYIHTCRHTTILPCTYIFPAQIISCCVFVFRRNLFLKYS
jgi:hypothetical protein